MSAHFLLLMGPRPLAMKISLLAIRYLNPPWWVILDRFYSWISRFHFYQIFVNFSGEFVDLLQLYGVHTHMGHYVALVSIYDRRIIKHHPWGIVERWTISDYQRWRKKSDVTIICYKLLCLEAVRSRFKLNRKMVLAEWPILRECVLQKRRNESGKKTERAILVITIQLNLYHNQLTKNILMVRMASRTLLYYLIL